MKTFDVEQLRRLFRREGGLLYWRDVSKYHNRLNGKEAGSAREGRSGKSYWFVKIGGEAFKRSHIIFAMVHGRWASLQIDHISGDSLNDDPTNLREATPQQNNWNHKTRKKASPLPMGVRSIPSGRFVARLCGKSIGTFDSAGAAERAYRAARLVAFKEFA